MNPEETKDLERLVLGALMIDGEPFRPDAVGIQTSDFTIPRHREIFAAMISLEETGDPIDWAVLKGRLPNVPTDYLVELADDVVTAANLRYHASELRREARRRRYTHTLAAAGGRITHDPDPDSVATELVAGVTSISEGGMESRPTPMDEIIKRRFAALKNQTEIVGITTGIEALDDQTAGMSPGQFIVIGGRPSMGKTSLGLQLADHVAIRKDMDVLVFSLEMSEDELADRLLSMQSGVNLDTMRRARVADDEWDPLHAAANRLFTKRLEIIDSGDMSIAGVRAQARLWAARSKRRGLVIVDYIQLMDGDGDTRDERVSSISRGLKGLAREIGAPVVGLSQLNRSVEGRADKRPLLSDLRESGSLEQDADQVWLLYREDYYNQRSDRAGEADIGVAKNRNGPVGCVTLAWDGKRTRFSEL